MGSLGSLLELLAPKALLSPLPQSHEQSSSGASLQHLPSFSINALDIGLLF